MERVCPHGGGRIHSLFIVAVFELWNRFNDGNAVREAVSEAECFRGPFDRLLDGFLDDEALAGARPGWAQVEGRRRLSSSSRTAEFGFREPVSLVLLLLVTAVCVSGRSLAHDETTEGGERAATRGGLVVGEGEAIFREVDC